MAPRESAAGNRGGKAPPRRPGPGHAPTRLNRGVVSVVALVAVIACAVATASVAAWSGAQSEMADARGRREVGVNLALSGVHGVVTEVAKQRHDLLRGATLNLAGHTVVWTGSDAGGVALSGVVRLMPLGGDGAVVQMEGAKLDVNEASEERIKALAGAGVATLTSETLAHIVTGRSSRAWGSVWEILAVGSGSDAASASAPSRSGARTGGPGTSERPDDGAAEGADADNGAAVENESPARSTLSGPELLTCYSADPQERSGFTLAGAVDPDATGTRRLVLPEKWSDEAQKQVAAQIGEQGAAWLKGQYGANKRPTSATVLAGNAAADRVEPVVVAGMLDALEFDDAGTRRGLVDLLTAPTEILAGVPGIPAALADRIVAARGKLESSRKATALWPVLEGLVELKDFAPALDFVTSRCLVFRVMVEGGVARGELRGEAESWVLGDRWAYEVIVDASETPVRIAYLRGAAFDALVIPGAKEPESAAAPANEAGGGTADEPATDGAGSQDVTASASTANDEEPSAADSLLPRNGSGGSGVDSPAGAASGPTVPASASATPARTRIGRWCGGGGGGSSSGGTPK